jgi:hypothetical protein
MRDSNSRTPAWVALTVLLALGAAWLGATWGRNDGADERAALQQRLDALEQRMGGLEGQPAAAATGTVPATSAPGTALAAPAEPAGMPAAPAADPEVVRAGLEADYTRERRDAAWAATAELALSKAAAADELVAANLVPTAIDTRCRARTCRTVATFADAGQAEEWVYGYMTNTAGTLRMVRPFRRVLPDGRVELTLYGTR